MEVKSLGHHEEAAAHSDRIQVAVDLDALVGARYDFDVVGHYSRPDLFSLTVDERSRPGVTFADS
jgi:hypothetical protein